MFAKVSLLGQRWIPAPIGPVATFYTYLQVTRHTASNRLPTTDAPIPQINL
jgi:hypothetical protein